MKTPSESESFGWRLRWLREAYGLSLTEFGKRIGAGASYLSKLENSERDKPSDQFVFSVTQIFNVRRDWLLFGAGQPFALYHLARQAADGKKLQPPAINAIEETQKPLNMRLNRPLYASVSNPGINELGWLVSDFSDKLLAGPFPFTIESLRIVAHELAAQLNSIADIAGALG